MSIACGVIIILLSVACLAYVLKTRSACKPDPKLQSVIDGLEALSDEQLDAVKKQVESYVN